jgi:uncharacterized membrane protein|tara:strand:+ start:94 stop:927 length:834 start_codon:yes stop_codon:yes gene_type:complete
MDLFSDGGVIQAVSRWLHIIAGITWIGLLYFFNFINGHLAATYDADSKKKVVPELMPRALYWFRWGAAWTWFTGIILLVLVFWIADNSYMPSDFTSERAADGTKIAPANMWIHISLTVTFLSVFLYDFFYKTSLGKNARVATIISFAYVAGFIFLMSKCGGMEYRAYNIHVGAMFGTIMAFNVWFRIWPAQQKIITAIKNGDAPNGDDVGLAGLRSKHNTYMSIPLIWTMISGHHSGSGLWSGQYGISGELWFLIMIALGWHIVFQLYKKSAKVQGF